MKSQKPKSNWQLNKLVIVYWDDACSMEGWEPIEVYKEHGPMSCRSVGFLLTSDSNRVTLSGTESEHGQLNQAMSIPRAWISRIQVVEDLLVSPKKSSTLKKKTT